MLFPAQRAGRDAQGESEKRASYCEDLYRGCHGRHGNRLVFGTASQFLLKNGKLGEYSISRRRLLVQQIYRITLVQHAFDDHYTIDSGGAFVSLRYFLQNRR